MKENKKTYAIYVDVHGRDREEHIYDAHSIEEALGMFFMDNSCLSYDDVIDHMEI